MDDAQYLHYKKLHPAAQARLPVPTNKRQPPAYLPAHGAGAAVVAPAPEIPAAAVLVLSGAASFCTAVVVKSGVSMLKLLLERAIFHCENLH